MINKIYTTELLAFLDNITEENTQNGQNSEEFTSGMQFVVNSLKNYLKGPPYVLSEDFKNFALREFLNNEDEKLPVFSNLMKLFELKMQQIGREATWGMYPEEMDKEVTELLKSCFDGVTFLNIYTDFDRQAHHIDLSLIGVTKDDEAFDISMSEYSMIVQKEEEEEEYEYHREIGEFNSYLQADAHYESLFLFACLKKFFNYINAQKVEELLKNAIE